MAKQSISEANVSRAIRDFLDAKRVRYHRLNAGKQIGSYTSKRTGKTNSWAIGMQEKGCADLLALVKVKVRASLASEAWIEYPHPVFIEVKRPGGKQTKEQIDFAVDVQLYGCSYLLADNVDCVMEWFRNHGL